MIYHNSKILKLVIPIIVIIFINCLFISKIQAQDECTTKLRNAERLYEEGKIEQVPALLINCIENGLNKEGKISALRLLAMVYLFEDKQSEAEQAMLKILKMDPEYSVNEAIDEVNYIRLYKQFNTDPVFSIGLLGGVNSTTPLLKESIGVNSFNSINPRYNGGLNLAIGFKSTYHFSNNIDISLEPTYHSSSFILQEDVTQYEYNEVDEQINLINTTVVGNYGFWTLKHSQLFVDFGFTYGYLLSGSQEIQSRYNSGSNQIPSPTKVNTSDLRTKHNYSLLAGVGSKIYLDRSFLQLNVRYSFGLNNIVQSGTIHQSNTTIMQWGNRHIDNYMRLTYIMFGISYNYEFYKHKR